METTDSMDPIVIDPPGFNSADGWAECKEYVEKCGGLSHDDGEPNWRAAFGADPGLCSCPACHQMYWQWGRRQQCKKCGFEYPTDAWPMYSWGSQDAKREPNPRYAGHPYYEYGRAHPFAGDLYEEFHRINWREVIPRPSNP